jgi:hypothetical protein
MHTELEHGTPMAQLLRDLPADDARPYDFGEFQRRARAAPAAAARAARLRALAAAIVVALAIGAAIIRCGIGSHPASPPAPLGADRSAVPLRSTASADVANDDADAQQWLESLPREPGVVRVGRRAAVATLEDHLAEVDDLLSSERAGRATPARLAALQKERSQLVSSLVQVRYAETLADASR